MKRTELSVVDLSDVLKAVGFEFDDAWHVVDIGFTDVSFGDASYTLIGNGTALDYIVLGNHYLDNPMDKDELTRKYWEVVQDNDFINLEA